MRFSVNDFDSIINIDYVFTNVYSRIYEYLSFSINDFLDMIGVDFQIPSWIGGNLTPFELMFYSVVLYLGYQFLTWLFNLIT